MNKRIIVFITTLLLCGCAEEDKEIKNNSKPEIEKHGNIQYIVDTETGVNYIVYRDTVAYGISVAMHPRLNVDGSLFVSEVENGK